MGSKLSRSLDDRSGMEGQPDDANSATLVKSEKAKGSKRHTFNDHDANVTLKQLILEGNDHSRGDNHLKSAAAKDSQEGERERDDANSATNGAIGAVTQKARHHDIADEKVELQAEALEEHDDANLVLDKHEDSAVHMNAPNVTREMLQRKDSVAGGTPYDIPAKIVHNSDDTGAVDEQRPINITQSAAAVTPSGMSHKRTIQKRKRKHIKQTKGSNIYSGGQDCDEPLSKERRIVGETTKLPRKISISNESNSQINGLPVVPTVSLSTLQLWNQYQIPAGGIPAFGSINPLAVGGAMQDNFYSPTFAACDAFGFPLQINPVDTLVASRLHQIQFNYQIMSLQQQHRQQLENLALYFNARHETTSRPSKDKNREAQPK
ncbi:hypothetical protein MPSEU_000619500 [Mayamaea pseudoterrestris]|nr:hypothetical protein MPSEU_000619500 [Mayamaea pseudoterrestris]